jgi:hypothetical protein
MNLFIYKNYNHINRRFRLMRKWYFAAGLLVILSLTVQLVTASSLDPNYIKNFGWGKVIVSDKAAPAFEKCDMSIFDYRDGVFYIKGGSGAAMHGRTLIRDGKTYAYFLNKLEQSNPEKLKTRTETLTYYHVWVSHDMDGNKLYNKWPSNVTEEPHWQSLDKFTYTTDSTTLARNGGVIPWSKFERSWRLKQWLENAKPGYKIYINQTVGYEREMPEARYWNQNAGRWMNPTESVYSEPLAGATIVIK